ncbi:NfeD family protein [Ollibium composti]|uniref:NfeD family protein n=1 Tax=Ollibium composti TaxID=2675109 RepID=A0ABY2Q8I9_9HYPH|nr:NfeD family protein [Mesorhizobium composti]THF57922.1 NfeD family protein [Mesorhizobium composti]
MLERIFAELGPWNWMVLGFILLVLEIAVPGVFLLWIGIAALIVGAVSLALWDAGFWIWQVQVVAFLALSLVSAYVGKQIVGRREGESDQPLLNRRGEQMIGRTATLVEPIREGRGRIQLGDTLWRVSGPDLPAGTRVRVTGTTDTDLELKVEPVP